MAKRVSDQDRARYVLYFRGHREPDQHPRYWVPVLFSPGEALSIIHKFFGDRPHTTDGDTITLTDTPFSMSSSQLDEILSAEPEPVADEYLRSALRFRLGSWDEDHTKRDEPETTVDEETGKIIKVKAPKPEKPKKPGVPDGYVTIGEWCKKWNIAPPDARAALRGSNMTKPEYGWAFDPKREKEIKKLCGVKS